MKKEFQYSAFRRWLPLAIAPILIAISYGLTLEVIQSKDTAFAALCLLSAGMFLYLSIKIPNQSLLKVFTSKDGLTISNLLNSTHIRWDEIIEYGKYRRMFFGRKVWCFYVKSILLGDKKITVGFEYLKDVKALNNIIIKKAHGAKFKNTKIM